MRFVVHVPAGQFIVRRFEILAHILGFNVPVSKCTVRTTMVGQEGGLVLGRGLRAVHGCAAVMR